MTAAAPLPFPWPHTPSVSRAELSLRTDLLRRLRHAVDESRVVPALRRLLGDELEVLPALLAPRPRASDGAPPSGELALVLDWPGTGLRCRVRPEADLLCAAVARLLGEQFDLGRADAGLDATLRGAGAALLLDVARRATRGEAPTLEEVASQARRPGLSARVTVRLGDRPYAVELELEGLPTRRAAPTLDPGVSLVRLGDVCIALPWVAAISVVAARDLAALGVGDLWLPGAGWVSADSPLEAGIVAPGHSEHGLPVRVSGTRTVLGPKRVPLEPRVESNVSREPSDVEQVVGEAPVVVRLEVGALEMSAAHWAALRPGDVVQSGRRVEEPVVLRAAGREIARGELVDVEGEIGVRITEVVGGPPSSRSGAG